MSELLAVRNLYKGYRSGDQRLQVLADLSLEVAEGEIVAVTGVSGSGKSTLLHLVGGMERPDAGSIRIKDTELWELDRSRLSMFRNQTIGFVFQFHHLLPEFTALENVLMPLLLRGKSKPEVSNAGLMMLAEVGLEDRAHHRPGELSGGEQQRVALARALIGEPRLLLADEPTGNLDPQTGEGVSRLFRSLQAKYSLTSILVTHNEKLAQTCSRTYVLENGKLV
jgi:lipoprotein-releasing system ATP-binding protein